MRHKFYAIISTARDWTEAIEALHRSRADAVAGLKRIAAQDKPRRFIRFWVKRVRVTVAEVLAVAEIWGRMDAEAGERREDAAALPEPYRTAYLRGFNANAN